jgi:hypothetical protein
MYNLATHPVFSGEMYVMPLNAYTVNGPKIRRIEFSKNLEYGLFHAFQAMIQAEQSQCKGDQEAPRIG